MCVILPLLMFSYQNLAGNCVAGESFEKSAWNKKKEACFASAAALHIVIKKFLVLFRNKGFCKIYVDHSIFVKIMQDLERFCKIHLDSVQQEHIRVCKIS